jgi:ferredoxin-NADP reductase
VAELRSGRIVGWRDLSPVLALFRLEPEPGHPFPPYEAGQYIALRRENCRLTKKVVTPEGSVRFVPDLDEDGRERTGPVSHSYSIASAPHETAESGALEFYVVLVAGGDDPPGRFTDPLFRARDQEPLGYTDRIVGDFTLAKRATPYANVVMVGTGTGVAPFVSMLKELDHRAGLGDRPPWRFTLIHTNRTPAELAYHGDLLGIEDRGRIDLAYVPTVSRPGPSDGADPRLGSGRANNVLRHLVGLEARGDGARNVAARIPERHSREGLLERLDPRTTIILTCGNAALMEDIRQVAEAARYAFAKEDW